MSTYTDKSNLKEAFDNTHDIYNQTKQSSFMYKDDKTIRMYQDVNQ